MTAVIAIPDREVRVARWFFRRGEHMPRPPWRVVLETVYETGVSDLSTETLEEDHSLVRETNLSEEEVRECIVQLYDMGLLTGTRLETHPPVHIEDASLTREGFKVAHDHVTARHQRKHRVAITVLTIVIAAVGITRVALALVPAFLS